MANVIIYTRVSTDEQALRGNSLADQKDKLEQYCKIKDYFIISHYQDDHSAKSFDRPAFKRLLEYIKKNKHEVDKLIVIKWDRFSRNMTDALIMIRTLGKLGVEVEAMEQPLDLKIPENKLLLSIYLSAPEVENERRGLNIFNGIRRANKEGRYVSPAPFGFSYGRDEQKKPLLMANEKAPLVQEAFELYATGKYTKEELRRMFTKKGCKLGKNAFSVLFHNPTYYGKVILRAFNNEPEKLVDGLHQPLISEELFMKVQDVAYPKKALLGKPKAKKDELPLRGHLLCPACGANLTGSASKGRRGGRYFYYHCQPGCKARFRADVANDAFINWLNGISIKPEYVDNFLALFEKIYHKEEGDRKMEITKVERQLADAEDKLLKTDMKFIEEAIDKDSYNRLRTIYKSELKKLKKKRVELEGIDKDFPQQLEFAFQIIGNLGKLYQEANLEERQQIVGSIFPEKLIFDGESYRTPKPDETVSLIFNFDSYLEGIKKGQAIKPSDLSRLVELEGFEPSSRHSAQ